MGRADRFKYEIITGNRFVLVVNFTGLGGYGLSKLDPWSLISRKFKYFTSAALY